MFQRWTWAVFVWFWEIARTYVWLAGVVYNLGGMSVVFCANRVSFELEKI